MHNWKMLLKEKMRQLWKTLQNVAIFFIFSIFINENGFIEKEHKNF